MPLRLTPSKLTTTFTIESELFVPNENKIRVCRLFDSRYDEKTTNNDIALLKLKKKIDFKKYSGTVLPVCLPDLPRKYYGETVTHKTKIVAFFSSKFLHQVTVSGWGLLSDGGKAARKLQEVDLEVPIAQCHCLLHNAHCPRSITHCPFFLPKAHSPFASFVSWSISDNLDEGVPGGLPLQENLDILQNDVHLQVG